MQQLPPAVVVRARGVRSMADDAPDATAVGLRDGRVVHVGQPDDCARLVGPDAPTIDLGESHVLPGLIDTHPHLTHFSSLGAHLVDLFDAVDHDDIVARIAARAAETPPGEWIQATPVGEPHYFIRRSWRDLREGRFPDRHVLDRASADHPVFIQAWAPRTPNTCGFNTAALRRLGLDRSTPTELEGVTVHTDADGFPTGILTGAVNNYYNAPSFFDSLHDRLPPPLVPRAAFEAMPSAMAAYNAMGVTTIYEGHSMGSNEIELYRALRQMDRLTLRVLVAPEAEVTGLRWGRRFTDEQFLANVEKAAAEVALDDDWLRQSGVTMQRGGPCWAGLMLSDTPYTGPFGEPTTGVEMLSRTKARLLIEACDRLGLRLNIVAVTPREHDEWLDDIAELTDRTASSAPWLVQHAFWVDPERADRYRRAGFDVTTSLSFVWGKGDLYAERLGEDHFEHLVALRTLLDAGLRVGCGTDWGPKNVFEHLWLALTHTFAGSGRTNRGPNQTVSRTEALAMWTTGAARVLGWDGIGSLRSGHHADLVVVDRDPLTCDLDDLADTVVEATIVGGRIVHGAERLEGAGAELGPEAGS